MKIGIDARLFNETGVGRYIRNLISQLEELDLENEYVIFLRQKEYKEFSPKNERWYKKLADVQWHGLKEQMLMPQILNREKLDLVHFPYFSVPVLYRGKHIVTVHDLTITHFDTGRATTLPLPLYKLKRAGYNLVLKTAIQNASKIIAVSEYTKKEILEHFKVASDKVVVTYEAGSIERKNQDQTSSCPVAAKQAEFPNKYFLYVGNAHPHKNLEKLISAFARLNNNEFKLVLVGNDNFFYPRLKNYVKEQKIENIIFPGYVENNQLPIWYKNAYAFIFPSLMEGFGLPALEAMENDCPVLSSNSSSLPEICGTAAIYFNPTEENEITAAIGKIINNPSLRDDLILKGKDQSQKFSWKKMAELTLQMYINILT